MTISANHRRLMLRALVKAALPAVEALPPGERADAFEGIAIACKRDDAEMHRIASEAAQCLREAQGAQMTFHKLLS